MLKLITIVSFTFAARHVSGDDVFVEAPIGQMKGITMESQKGHPIFAFLGIPYAEPPVGPLRFKDPVPKAKWSGVFDATDDGHTCPQYEMLFKNMNQSEDCLVLNVYTRNLNGNAPVMFYVHGGAHILGTSNITINYRLGVFGLAATENGDATGNYLFKDVIMALKWVKENIKSFGGNPDCVTLFGHSAGALTSTTMLVSPMAKGLVHRVIGMAGSSASHQYLESKYWTMKMAEDVGCGHEEHIIECLRNLPWETLRDAGNKWEEDTLITFRFNFEIEKDFGQEKFLEAHPNDHFESGDFLRIPIMMGQTKNEFESLGAFVYYVDKFRPILNQINTDFEKIAPILCHYNANASNANHIAEVLKEKYLNNELVTEDNLRDLGKLLTDGFINHATYRTVSLVRKYSNIYYYRLDYENDFTYLTLSKGKKWSNARYEVQYLFDFKEAGFFEKGSEDERIMDLMTGIFTRFAATGNPNEHGREEMWKPSNSHEFSMVLLNTPDENGNLESVNVDPYEDRYRIWDELFHLKN
uniref:Carboxylic ester hydrolase n=1 Tax=Megaselia scalaris TaxID=36166 RepID=T1GSD6_MEGSC